MRVLIACEYSATEREAFAARGHEVLSCDLLPTDVPGAHYQGDVFDIIDDGWDLMIAHPPCTYLCNSGVRWLHERDGRWGQMEEGALFFRQLLEADIPRIAVENPIMHRYGVEVIGRKQDQIVQPWMFGHTEIKATAYWLKNLPLLSPTNDVKAETMALPYSERAKVHHAAPGPDRWKLRSTSYSGIAAAMATQWGSL